MTAAGWSIGLVLLAGLIGGLGPVYLKKGADAVTFGEWSTIYKNKFLIIGILVYSLSTILFIPALKGGDLSVLYPLVGLVYVWASIYAIFILGEKMTKWKWLGIIIVIMGAALISST